jgi:hypothetical protein
LIIIQSIRIIYKIFVGMASAPHLASLLSTLVREHILRTPIRFVLVVPVLLLAAACSEKTPTTPTPPVVTAPVLTAPALDAPSDDQQLTTLRPELTVRNGTSSQTAGTRTYEFQIADNTGFAPLAAAQAGIAENAGGKTSFTPTQDLQPTTRMYWRARMVQGTTNSDWSATGKFKTRLVGFNRPGALFDPLVNGETIGTIGGSSNITWIPGQGIRLNDALAYVVYDLPQVVLTGELSVEVTGLGPGGPCCKVRVFSIIDRVGALSSSSPYSMNAQYRGVNGNPDNCICFKSIFGNNALGLEPTTAQRLGMSFVLDPSKVYLWRGVWTRDSYRLIVREGGATGPLVYDFGIQSPQANWNPSKMFAFLGTDNGRFDVLDGTLRGITLRNLWVGSTPRPSSLGSATAPVP